MLYCPQQARALDVFMAQQSMPAVNYFPTSQGSRVVSDMGAFDDVATAMTKEVLEEIEPAMVDMDKLLLSNRIFIDRLEGIGILPKEDAIALGITGPNLRASGVEYDIRRANPYLYYDEIDFKIPTFPEGDCLARYFQPE